MTGEGVERARDHCAAMVRRADYDRYLTTLFAPAAARPGLLALYAFNQEVAKIRETVTEPLLGQIRLQWWREAIAELHDGKLRAHPVVAALATVLEEGRARGAHPAQADFERLLDARELDLAGRAPATLAELEVYCTETSATLLWLAAALLGAPDEPTRKALAPLGVAWALVGLARAMPFHARARRRFVPDEIAEEAGLAESALFEGKGGAAQARAATALVAAARRHLAQARADAGNVASPARSLLLFAPLARAYARRIESRGVDDAALTPAGKVLRLWWSARRFGR